MGRVQRSAECFDGAHLRCSSDRCICACGCQASAALLRWLARLSPAELERERRLAERELAVYFRLTARHTAVAA
jgi:hypothetical protein